MMAQDSDEVETPLTAEKAEERIKKMDSTLSKEQLVALSEADDWLVGLGTDSPKHRSWR